MTVILSKYNHLCFVMTDGRPVILDILVELRTEYPVISGFLTGISSSFRNFQVIPLIPLIAELLDFR